MSKSSLKASFRQTVASVLDILATRFSLISIELTEEKERLFRAFIFSGLGFIFFLVSLLTVTAWVVSLAWDTSYRDWVFFAVLLVYTIFSAFFFIVAKKALNNPRGIFADTIAVLERDRAVLVSDDESSKDPS